MKLHVFCHLPNINEIIRHTIYKIVYMKCEL